MGLQRLEKDWQKIGETLANNMIRQQSVMTWGMGPEKLVQSMESWKNKAEARV